MASSKLDEARKRWELGINSIFVSESFHIIARFLGQSEARKRVSLFCQSTRVIYVPIEKTTAVKALELAVIKSRKINDMMLAQHAIDSNADGIFTDNSKHFEGIARLKVYPLRSFDP